jgi:hypothetical protein
VGVFVVCALAAQQQGEPADEAVEVNANCALTTHSQHKYTYRPLECKTFPENPHRILSLGRDLSRGHIHSQYVAFQGSDWASLAVAAAFWSLVGRGRVGIVRDSRFLFVLCQDQVWRGETIPATVRSWAMLE